MTPQTIIEVLQLADQSIDYRIKTTTLDTKGYGIILASMLKMIVLMLESESEGSISADTAKKQIVFALMEELEHNCFNLTTNLMQ